METLIEVIHTQPTINQLRQQIIEAEAPVRRSTHVGNQNANELVIQAVLPSGVDVMAVDTITADDRYARPRVLRLGEGMRDIPLASGKSNKLIVGHARVREDIEKHVPADTELVCTPEAGESLQTFHMRALAELDLHNMPIPMSQFYGQQPDVCRAILAAGSSNGDTGTRVCDEQGRVNIIDGEAMVDALGIFGIDDASTKFEGVMPTLQMMMAADIVTSLMQGSERTIHLAGPDMVRYTRDMQIMRGVGRLASLAVAELGHGINEGLVYEVADISGLSRLVSADAYNSQHQLLRVMHQQLDLVAL